MVQYFQPVVEKATPEEQMLTLAGWSEMSSYQKPDRPTDALNLTGNLYIWL